MPTKQEGKMKGVKPQKHHERKKCWDEVKKQTITGDEWKKRATVRKN